MRVVTTDADGYFQFEQLKDGTYSLVASLGDDTDLLLSGPATDYADETNGIDIIDNSNLDEKSGMKDDGSVFDLQGRKVLNGSLPKGVYIVNGKKIVSK